MNVTYSDKLRENRELSALAQQATEQLKEVLTPSGEFASAEWGSKEDARGRPRVSLQLSDWSGAVSGEFTREELADPLRMSIRLPRLWGDLLEMRSHKQLQKLRELIEASEQESATEPSARR